MKYFNFVNLSYEIDNYWNCSLHTSGHFLCLCTAGMFNIKCLHVFLVLHQFRRYNSCLYCCVALSFDSGQQLVTWLKTLTRLGPLLYEKQASLRREDTGSKPAEYFAPLHAASKLTFRFFWLTLNCCWKFWKSASIFVLFELIRYLKEYCYTSLWLVPGKIMKITDGTVMGNFFLQSYAVIYSAFLRCFHLLLLFHFSFYKNSH